MPRFEKTRLHWAAAVCGLIGIYALGGMVYAASVHSAESVTIWAVIAVVAVVAGFGWQRIVTHQRKREP